MGVGVQAASSDFSYMNTVACKISVYQLLVSCGGGRRLADGLRQQHVRTIRLLMWDTLVDFTAILTLNVGQGKQHVTPMWRGRISTG